MSVNNEKGYVLLLTLVVIVIIGVLIPPLIGSALNSASQAQRSEESSQLVKMNEMGIMYARNTILEKVDDIKDLSNTSTLSVIGYLNSELDEFEINNLLFEDYKGELKGVFTEINSDEDDQIDIVYEVEASLLNGKSNSEIAQETFTLKSSIGDINWSERFNEPPFHQRDGSTGRETKFTSNDDIIIENNATFLDELTIPGGGGNRYVEVTGNVSLEEGAWFSNDGKFIVGESLLVYQSTILLNQKSSIVIKGDLYLVDAVLDINSNGSKNDAHVCVEGNVKESYSGLSPPDFRDDIETCDEIEESGFYVLGEILPYDNGSLGSQVRWIPVGTTTAQ